MFYNVLLPYNYYIIVKLQYYLCTAVRCYHTVIVLSMFYNVLLSHSYCIINVQYYQCFAMFHGVLQLYSYFFYLCTSYNHYIIYISVFCCNEVIAQCFTGICVLQCTDIEQLLYYLYYSVLLQ